ncbi:MAG: hypothetical protein IV093_07740 [Rubrivivax sp.]|nr:hypothetical protein [Rubrivivax sp.]
MFHRSVCRPAARPVALAVLAALALTACGGGDDGDDGNSAEPGITLAGRVAAATATAQTNPQCAQTDIGPFYWEVGDRDGVRASGSVGAGAPGASTEMAVYSASKWLYAAWVAQARGLRDDDVPYLNFTSGYTRFGPPLCLTAGSVAECGDSAAIDPAAVGRYVYDSGHMQVHAQTVLGLGAAGNADLAAALNGALGVSGLGYSQPQLAAGVSTTAAAYAGFLRRLLRGELTLADGLGSHKVCASPAHCANADAAPSTGDETWNYSLGHWVEDDPVVGDHAFSSGGAGGFYPWINRDRTLYGIVARLDLSGEGAGYQSAQCGRLIRQAWVTGQTVTVSTPTP